MREGWKTLILEEVAEVVGGGTPSTKEPSYWGGDVQWITPSEITAQEGRVISKTERTLTTAGLENSSAKLLPPGTVLLTSRATIGAVALAGAEMATNQGFASLVPRRDVVLPQYLMYWCQLNKDEFIRRAGGNTFKEVSKKKVASVPLSIPPLEEQRRIVDLLSSIDQAISKTEEMVDRITSTRGSLLEESIFGQGFDLAPLRSLAVEGGLVGGPFGSSLVSKDYRDTGVPVIRGTNLSNRRSVGGDFVFVSAEKADSLSRNIALPGDLVATQRGTLGQVALVPHGAFLRYVVSQSQMRLRVDPARASTDFVYYVLSSPSAVHMIESRKIATANPHINLGIFGDLEIPLPPLAKQNEIVQTLQAIDAVQESSRAAVNKLHRFRSGVLSTLLSGEHEIPDSYDRLLEEAS